LHLHAGAKKESRPEQAQRFQQQPAVRLYGVSLSNYWATGMKTFHGFLSHGFPTCFHVGLTQTGLVPNFTYTADRQSKLSVHLITQVNALNAQSIEPTARLKRCGSN
jgi:hypothetical protein